jgi:hypothetical protein
VMCRETSSSYSEVKQDRPAATCRQRVAAPPGCANAIVSGVMKRVVGLRHYARGRRESDLRSNHAYHQRHARSGP